MKAKLHTVAAVCIGLIVSAAFVAGCFEFAIGAARGAHVVVHEAQMWTQASGHRMAIRKAGREVAFIDADGHAHAAPGMSADDVAEASLAVVAELRERLDQCLGRDEE